MMTGEITVVPQCRVGLAPAVCLTARPGCWAAVGMSAWCRVPWAAIAGSHDWLVVLTACRYRVAALGAQTARQAARRRPGRPGRLHIPDRHAKRLTMPLIWPVRTLLLPPGML
jgi:hypothetical protein